MVQWVNDAVCLCGGTGLIPGLGPRVKDLHCCTCHAGRISGLNSFLGPRTSIYCKGGQKKNLVTAFNVIVYRVLTRTILSNRNIMLATSAI